MKAPETSDPVSAFEAYHQFVVSNFPRRAQDIAHRIKSGRPYGYSATKGRDREPDADDLIGQLTLASAMLKEVIDSMKELDQLTEEEFDNTSEFEHSSGELFATKAMYLRLVKRLDTYQYMLLEMWCRSGTQLDPEEWFERVTGQRATANRWTPNPSKFSTLSVAFP